MFTQENVGILKLDITETMTISKGPTQVMDNGMKSILERCALTLTYDLEISSWCKSLRLYEMSVDFNVHKSTL